MSTFRSTLFLALLVSQAAAFFVADKSVKALGPLQSTFNRNYDPVGYGYENDRYDGGMRRYNEYGNSYNNNRYGNEYGRVGGYNSYDRGYGYGGVSRSKYSDWLNGSSNYIPTSADRNYVMDRGYETNRYSNYYNGDRYNDRYPSYNRNDRYNSGGDRYYSDRFAPGGNGRYGGRDYYSAGRRNSFDRYSPVGYSSNTRNYERNYNNYNGGNRDMMYSNNRNYDRTFNSKEYQRTYRSPMDSHRQEYPTYGMGAMEDQFGYKKWWDSN